MSSSLESIDERILSLSSDLKSYGKEIVDFVGSQYSINSSIGKFKQELNLNINLKSDPKNAIPILRSDLNEILAENSNNRSNQNENLKEMEIQLHLLENISTICDSIMKCEEFTNKYDLMAASKIIKSLETSISTSLPNPNTEYGSGVICTTLIKEVKLLKYRLQSTIRRLILNCFVVDFGRITILKSLKGLIRSEEAIIDNPIYLTDLWHSMLLLETSNESTSGGLQTLINDILKTLWLNVMKPLWKEKKFSLAKVITNEENAILTFENMIRDSFRTTTGDVPIDGSAYLCRMPVHHLFECLNQVLSFIWLEIFCGLEDLSIDVSIGLGLRQGLGLGPINLMQTLRNTILSSLPKIESEVLTFQKLLEKPCRDFETKLESYHLLLNTIQNNNEVMNTKGPPQPSNTGNKSLTLVELIDDLSLIFAEMKRKEILTRARELVLADYHNTMLGAGDALEDETASAGDIGDPKAMLETSSSFVVQVLHFDSCQVSLAACRLLKLMHEVMKTATCKTCSPHLAGVLYQSSRDCMELFMAIVPMKFAEIIDTLPRMGAVFYNDCMYLAHNTTLITHRYQSELGKVDECLLYTLGFVDMIPRLRVLGEGVLMKHVHQQMAVFAEIVLRMNVDPNVETSEQDKSSSRLVASKTGNIFSGGLQRAAERINSKLIHVTGSVSSTLSSTASGTASSIGGGCNNEEAASQIVQQFERLKSQWQGVLQDAVFERLTGYLLDAVLRSSMDSLLEAECITESAAGDISRLFKYIQKVRFIFPSGSSSEEYMQKLAVSWNKFCALTDLLEYSLSEIAEWLPRKKFSSFTSQQLSTLIRALFEDSIKRQNLLTSILDMST